MITSGTVTQFFEDVLIPLVFSLPLLVLATFLLDLLSSGGIFDAYVNVLKIKNHNLIDSGERLRKERKKEKRIVFSCSQNFTLND